MAEFWFDNPTRVARTTRRRTRTRRRRSNPGEGGLLMLANRKRKRSRSRKRAMPPALKAYWADKRRGTGRRRKVVARRVRVVHYATNRKRRRGARSSGGGGGVGVPASVGGFLSTRFLMGVGAGVVGALVPSFVVDRLLPMVGLTFTGFTRRLVVLGIPIGVVLLGGKRLLGPQTAPFVLGGFIVGGYGLAQELLPVGTLPMLASPPTGALGMYSRPPAKSTNLGRYGVEPRALQGIS